VPLPRTRLRLGDPAFSVGGVKQLNMLHNSVRKCSISAHMHLQLVECGLGSSVRLLGHSYQPNYVIAFATGRVISRPDVFTYLLKDLFTYLLTSVVVPSVEQET